jgi:hypothetical protein
MASKKPKRRKPKRKRLTSVRQPSNFPYSKYRIEWIDIIGDSGWADENKFDKMSLATPVNEGWVYEKNKKHIKIFASYDKDDDGYVFGDRTMIPRSCITKITKLN